MEMHTCLWFRKPMGVTVRLQEMCETIFGMKLQDLEVTRTAVLAGNRSGRTLMTSELVINVTREESRVALLEGGQVVETLYRAQARCEPGRQHLQGEGSQDPAGMQSSFIDIGLEKAAFLSC